MKLYAIWNYNKGFYVNGRNNLPLELNLITAESVVDKLAEIDVITGAEKSHSEAKDNGYLVEEIGND